MQTLRHRLQTNTAFSKSCIIRFLLFMKGSGCTAPASVVRFCMACTPPDTLRQQLQKLDAFDIRALRAIAKSPVHLTKESNLVLSPPAHGLPHSEPPQDVR